MARLVLQPDAVEFGRVAFGSCRLGGLSGLAASPASGVLWCHQLQPFCALSIRHPREAESGFDPLELVPDR